MRTAGCRASPAGTASRPIIVLPSTSYSISVAVVIADGVSRTLPATPVVRWGEDPRQCPQVEPLPGPLPFTRAVTGGGVHGIEGVLIGRRVPSGATLVREMVDPVWHRRPIYSRSGSSVGVSGADAVLPQSVQHGGRVDAEVFTDPRQCPANVVEADRVVDLIGGEA